MAIRETKPLLDLTEFTSAPRVNTSAVLPTGGFTKGNVYIRLGRLATTAFTAGVKFRVQVSPDESGNKWLPVSTLLSQLGASVAEEAVNGTCLADQPVVPMASTTGFIAGDDVYIDNTTTANSEFGVQTNLSADASITLMDDLANVQTGATVRDQAEIYAPVPVDLTNTKRIRVVVDGSGAGQNFAADIKLVAS